MTSPAGLLDFFILEASEYIEQLDELLARASTSGPDTDALLRSARALRGSATMAKLPSIADVAAGVERVGRAVQAGALAWEPALSGVVVSAVDDLKLLVRAVRSWTPAEDRRATTRVAELTRYAPLRAAGASTPAATSGTTFFSAEASNIAAGLELLTARPDRAGAINVLNRVRALRGVAGIKDVGPLARVMEAAELVLKPLELGEGEMSAEGLEVLRAGAELLRRLSVALRSGAPADAASPERDRFDAALAGFEGTGAASDRIVPIAELFYDDGGPTVVSPAPNPPTTPAERFRLEMVSQGEHLQRLVSEGRAAASDAARDEVRRELRHALGALRSAADSFGEHEVADLIAGHDDAVASLDYLALNALDALASVIANPGLKGERLAARLSELRKGRTLDSGIGDAFTGTEPRPVTAVPEARLSSIVRPVAEVTVAAPSVAQPMPQPPVAKATVSPSAPTPIVTPAIPAVRTEHPAAAHPAPAHPTPAHPTPAHPTPVHPTPAHPTPAHPTPVHPTPVRPTPVRSTPVGAAAQRRSGESLLAALDAGIAGFSELAEQPLSTPTPIDVPVIPIDALVYRGRAAIERAIAIRDEVRRAGAAPERETLDELFDLLDLALVE